MPLAVECPGCQAGLKVSAKLAGRQVKCPRCQQRVSVPQLETAGPSLPAVSTTRPSPRITDSDDIPIRDDFAAPGALSSDTSVSETIADREAPTAVPESVPEDPRQMRRLMLAGFTADEIERVRTPLTYRFGILMAALVMVTLPLIYLAFIGLIGYGVYYHLANHHGMLNTVRNIRGQGLLLVVYLAPAVVGPIMILFMLKPFFAPPGREEYRRRSINRGSEPLLYEFVERIAGLVGAPLPKRIDLVCDVNASASFRRGWWSMIVGNDLVLTLGVPLASGLTAQQLAVILAHELGHFNQGAGMRLRYVVFTMSEWFARVVYHRDGWDDWLVETCEDVDLRIGWILYLARLGVWISRGVLWALMQVGNLVAAFLCRQGEYDADLCATRVAGCRAFEAANRRVNAMGMANDLGMRFDLPLFYQHGKLPDNLCRLMHLNLQRHREVIEPTVRLLTEGGTTGLFSTHPSDRDRIARSHRAGDEGVFQSKLPASSLFRNFEETSRRVTHDLYVGWFGKRLKIDALDPTDRVYDEIIPNPEAAPASAWS